VLAPDAIHGRESIHPEILMLQFRFNQKSDSAYLIIRITFFTTIAPALHQIIVTSFAYIRPFHPQKKMRMKMTYLGPQSTPLSCP